MSIKVRIHTFAILLAALGMGGCAALPEEVAEPENDSSTEVVASATAELDGDASASELAQGTLGRGAYDENVRGVRMEMGASPSSAANRAAYTAQSTYAICARVPWGPGWVNWGMASPSAAGFSVKPESSWSLVWATAPGQACDGIYRRSWGCGWAFKVPDSCTASVTSTGSISCCCNAAMAALGHVCQWVNPSSPSIGWPACPL